MTGEQIEKALECCMNSPNCEECIIPHSKDCEEILHKKSLDYINRLKEKNERLSVALKLAQTRANDAEEKLQANLEKAYEHNEQECKRCMEMVEFKHGLSIAATKKHVRKKTAKEILSFIDGIPTNEVNELNHLASLKNVIAEKYGVEVEE